MEKIQFKVHSELIIEIYLIDNINLLTDVRAKCCLIPPNSLSQLLHSNFIALDQRVLITVICIFQILYTVCNMEYMQRFKISGAKISGDWAIIPKLNKFEGNIAAQYNNIEDIE